MDVEHSIPKKSGSPDPKSFSGLRKEGLRLIQKMSGDVWSDYNLHDPGVTILEQLCFALTDLIYRSDFPVEDQLADDNGNIAFAEQALHRPEDILPCRPWTAVDYQQLILDVCPDIDNVWFTDSVDSALPAACPGVYVATAWLDSDADRDRDRARQDIKKAFAGARNLCEDIYDKVVILEKLECHLHGMVEIDGSHDPSDVLAHIYHRAALYVASGVQAHRPDGADSDVDLVEIFSGPRLTRGRTRPGGTAVRDDMLILSDLVGTLQDIEGVVRVHDLSLRVDHADGPRERRESVARRHGDKALWLRVPAPGDATDADSEGLRLLKFGRLLTASVADTRNKFHQLVTAQRSGRVKESDPADLYELPRGTKRRFGDYFSIQNHFPDVYGINAHGLPASASPQARVSARQLKAYLMLFEQFMTNHLANVDGIRELFAHAGSADRTYRYQVLDDNIVADSAQLYREEPGGFLDRVVTGFDDAAERKSRQLDYMLAVFGESFLQKSLRHFAHYSSGDEQHEQIVRNKAAFLEQILEVTRDRVGGRDYTRSDSVGGFGRRVSLLLGFRDHGRSLTAALRKAHLDPGAPATVARRSTDTRPGGGNVPVMRLAADAGRQALSDARRILQAHERSRELLAAGVDLENYRVAPRRDERRVALQIGAAASGWQVLANFADKQRAFLAANALRKYVIALCQFSEGMHVVEHLLLRPAAGRDTHAGRQPDRGSAWLWQQFYPLRFTAFFCGWTPRCRDPDFRLLAEETVRLNSPAHVYGQCLWLDFGQMRELESLLDTWSSLRQQSKPDPAQLDNSAVSLIDFTLSLHQGRL